MRAGRRFRFPTVGGWPFINSSHRPQGAAGLRAHVAAFLAAQVVAELAANSQREAFEIVHRRVTENIDEVQQLLRK